MTENTAIQAMAVAGEEADRWDADLVGVLRRLATVAEIREDGFLAELVRRAHRVTLQATAARREVTLHALCVQEAKDREASARDEVASILSFARSLPDLPSDLRRSVKRTSNRLRSSRRWRGHYPTRDRPSMPPAQGTVTEPTRLAATTWSETAEAAEAEGRFTEDEQASTRREARVLGPFWFLGQTHPPHRWGGSRGESVLLYLISERGRPVPKEVLMELLWADADPELSRRRLHQAVYSLRQVLRDSHTGSSGVLYEGGCYVLDPELELWFDVEEFEHQVTGGRRCESLGHARQAIDRYAESEELYRGEFLEEYPYEDWAVAERERLRMLYLDVAWRLGEMLLSDDRHVEALSVAQRILARGPSNEEATRLVMRCYEKTGQRNLALNQYHICAGALERELATEPTPATRELYETLKSAH